MPGGQWSRTECQHFQLTPSPPRAKETPERPESFPQHPFPQREPMGALARCERRHKNNQNSWEGEERCRIPQRGLAMKSRLSITWKCVRGEVWRIASIVREYGVRTPGLPQLSQCVKEFQHDPKTNGMKIGQVAAPLSAPRASYLTEIAVMRKTHSKLAFRSGHSTMPQGQNL